MTKEEYIALAQKNLDAINARREEMLEEQRKKDEKFRNAIRDYVRGEFISNTISKTFNEAQLSNITYIYNKTCSDLSFLQIPVLKIITIIYEAIEILARENPFLKFRFYGYTRSFSNFHLEDIPIKSIDNATKETVLFFSWVDIDAEPVFFATINRPDLQKLLIHEFYYGKGE